jgi:hypothetical protein
MLFLSQNQRIRSKISPVCGVGISGRRENKRKGGQSVKMVEIFCTNVCKLKNETDWNYSRNGGRGDKGEKRGVEFNYDKL